MSNSAHTSGFCINENTSCTPLTHPPKSRRISSFVAGFTHSEESHDLALTYAMTAMVSFSSQHYRRLVPTIHGFALFDRIHEDVAAFAYIYGAIACNVFAEHF